MALKRLAWLALAALAGLAGCVATGVTSTVDVVPPARAAVGSHVAAGIWEISVTDDIVFDPLSDDSRLIVWLELENRDVIPTRIDVNRVRLVAEPTDDRATAQFPIASGWDSFLGEFGEAARALPAELKAGEHRRAWVAFVPPASLRGPGRRSAGLSVVVEVDGQQGALVLADPRQGRPRWKRSMRLFSLGVFNTVLASTGVLGDALGLRATFAPGLIPLRLSYGGLVVRHNGHAEAGLVAGLQIDLPPRSRPDARFRFTPFLGVETALAAPSFPHRYPGQSVSLIGPLLGVELGFGTAIPANADVLPIDDVPPMSPFAIRLAYARWWGDIDGNPIAASGRSAALLSLVVTVGP